MSEQELADKFSEELDLMLDSGAIDDPQSEFAQDLAFAKELADADLSSESSVRGSLAAELESGPKKSWFSPTTLKFAGAFCVMVLCIPIFEYIASDPGDYEYSLQEGFDRKGAFFAEPQSLYEAGVEGISPGGLVGSSDDIITPLNSRDTTSLAGGSHRDPTVSTSDLRELAKGRLSKTMAKMSVKKPGFRGAGANAGSYAVATGLSQTTSMPAETGVSNGAPGWTVDDGQDREGYNTVTENPFRLAKDSPLSTFSIDVDAASYSNLRRILNEGRMPPAGAVRIEEMINYFDYEYPQPTSKHPFSITTELAACPWNEKHKLVHMGLQGKTVAKKNLPPSNLVFLIDTSGSMGDDIELVKKSLALLVKELREEDRIAIVAYAGSAGLVLPATSGIYKDKILSAIAGLGWGGSTAGGAGIKLAYDIAINNYRENGNNRVILATDGDFNVGLSSDSELVTMIEKKRASGIFLTVLGFGSGNYQDAKMEQLADKGNGNYSYIDTLKEANKVLVKEMGGTLLTIAKDVKIQVEFNPARVQAYRLVGYENRMLRAQDFNDDKKDAGELGAGHSVTALYEIVPAGTDSDSVPEESDSLKYQKPARTTTKSKELLTVKFRYKKPNKNKSRLLTRPLLDADIPFASGTENLRFSAAVAEFAMLLRKSKSAKSLSYDQVVEGARAAKGNDPHGYRAEFIKMVEQAKLLDSRLD